MEKQYFGCSTWSKNDVFISKWVNELVTSKASTGTIISRTFTILGGAKCPYTKGRSISKAGRDRVWPGRLKTPSQFKKMHMGGGGGGGVSCIVPMSNTNLAYQRKYLELLPANPPKQVNQEPHQHYL